MAESVQSPPVLLTPRTRMVAGVVENNPELACWKMRHDMKQRCIFPAETILDQPTPADLPAVGSHITSSAAYFEPILDQHGCSASS
ncbi:uncharacterized protein LOC144332973 isoform X2 [Macaca mulatta]